MNKIKTIQIKALLLLLVYIASNLPVSLFHSHENVRVSLSQATACEKKIYFGNVDGSCEHSTHITKQIKKCASCDQQLVTPHTTVDTFITLQKLSLGNIYKIALEDCIAHNAITHSNRGPPTYI